MENSLVTTTKVEEPVQLTMKDLKKVAVGKSLAEWNHNNKTKAGLGSQNSGEQTLVKSSLWHWGCHSCWGVRPSWLLCLPIQERRYLKGCHQGDSSQICRSSDPKTSKQVRNGVTLSCITEWTRKALLMTCTKQQL